MWIMYMYTIMCLREKVWSAKGGICFLFRYTPQTIELEYKIKPFIPDFIPAVGDIDAFIKVSNGMVLKKV